MHLGELYMPQELANGAPLWINPAEQLLERGTFENWMRRSCRLFWERFNFTYLTSASLKKKSFNLLSLRGILSYSLRANGATLSPELAQHGSSLGSQENF